MNKRNKRSTPDAILDAAHHLFLARGFSATSIDEICRKVKITKGGFFHHFKSKECLAKAVLEKFCSDAVRHIEASDKSSDPLTRVFSILDGVICHSGKARKHDGCLMAVFIQELSKTHPAIQSMCVQGLKGLASLIKKDLQLAKEQYAAASSINVGSLADYCVVVIEGAQILAKAGGNRRSIEESIQHLKNYLSLTFQTKQRRVL